MIKHDPSATWFLAQFKPNCQNIAERNLARQGFETFLPVQETTLRVRGRFATRLRPLFPGYIFVMLDVVRGPWRAVNSTSGIVRLVSLAKEPTPVPSELVRQLMQRCDRKGRLLCPTGLKAGDRVTVTQGPFTDFVASIDTIEPDRRIWVLMDLMGARTRVAVGAEQIRAG